MLTKDMSQGIVQIGSVFHGYLPFFDESEKDSLFFVFEKRSRKRFVSQSGEVTIKIMKFAIDGKEWISSGSFVSKTIYEAYRNNQNWEPEQFCKVELAGVLSAWITLNEKVQLEQRKTFDEIEKFTT